METFDIDNPMWSAVTSYTEATTNIPLNRLYNKTLNVRQSLNNQHSAFERFLMFSGWSQWNLGIEDEKMKKIKEGELAALLLLGELELVAPQELQVLPRLIRKALIPVLTLLQWGAVLI